jgi:hypothetical protein
MFSRLNVHNIHTTNEPSESVVAGSNLRARMSANATLSTTSALHHASSYSTATQIRTRQTTIIPRPLTRTTFPERTHNALLREHCAQRKKQYSAVNIWIYGEQKSRINAPPPPTAATDDYELSEAMLHNAMSGPSLSNMLTEPNRSGNTCIDAGSSPLFV